MPNLSPFRVGMSFLYLFLFFYSFVNVVVAGFAADWARFAGHAAIWYFGSMMLMGIASAVSAREKIIQAQKVRDFVNHLLTDEDK